MGIPVFEALPPDLFALRRTNIVPFVDHMQEFSGISLPAAEVCKIALNHMFDNYGGYYDEPTVPGQIKLDYHNGSHAGYVFAGSLWVAVQSGFTKREKELTALAGASHDASHDSHLPEEDEHKSVLLLQKWLGSSPLRSLSDLVANPLLCTIVDKIDKKGIYQRARQSADKIGGATADGDMFAFVAPTAGEIALNLLQEESKAEGIIVTRSLAADMLAQTAVYQETHEFITEVARERLHPIAVEAAARLREKIPELIADLPETA